MRALRAVLTLVLAVAAVALIAGEARAQGKVKGDKHGGQVIIVQQGHDRWDGHRKPLKKKVTVNDAAGIARAVLHEQGYYVVRIEQVRETQIIYYRRGNMGRGRGKGPIERMIIRPSSERVVIERAPRPVLAQINVRLGY